MNRRADLDGVRGFACLSVLILHIVVGPIQVTRGTWFETIRTAVQPFLVGGVDLFFVLSGFLIGGILLYEKGTPAKDFFLGFWRRRIGRIFPVYYLMIGVLLALYAVDAVFGFAYTKHLLYNQMPVWSYATFTQNFYMVFSGVYGNFLGVTWSLAMEEQFYMLLPFAVFFFSRGTIAKAAVALILLAPVIRTLVWQNINWQASYHLSPARVDTVMWGVLVAYVVRRPDFMAALASKVRWLDAIIVLAIISVAANTYYFASAPLISNRNTYTLGLFVSTLRYSVLAAMYGLVILRLHLPGATAMKAVFNTPWLGKVGIVSYAAYMYHQFFNMSAHFWLNGGRPATLDSWWLAYIPVLVLALTFAAATISYRFLEHPILTWARGNKPPGRAPSLPAAIPTTAQLSK